MTVLRELVPPAGAVRVLALSNLAKGIGNGILMTLLVLYASGPLGIPATRVGLALTIGAVAGMAVSVPAGQVADRFGARRTAVGSLLLLGICATGYSLVDTFWELAFVAALVLASDSAAGAARGALVAALVPRAERTRALSYMRSMGNIGIGIGALIGGLALRLDNPAAYRALLTLAGIVFAAAGLAFLTVPTVGARHAPAINHGWAVLRDRPYAAVAALNAVLAMNGGILVVALPVWIATHTSAPHSLYAALLLVNTVVVVMLQVWASRGVNDVTGGAATLRRAGIALGACCVLFAVVPRNAAIVDAVLLIAGTLVHVLGEMWYSVGSWALAFGLAPDHAQGQYQGFFGMSTQLSTAVTPLAVATLIVGLGVTGWLILALLMCTAGAACPTVARWAERSRSTPLASAK